MDRPRILLVPFLSELEWPIRPLIEEWAEVAAYDAPGVGVEPPAPGTPAEAVVRRGLEEIDRRGWRTCVVVGDEFGAYNAARLAAARPEAVEGVALGHPALSTHTTGERPALAGHVRDAFRQVLGMDYRAYARALTQVSRGGYDDETAERYIARVPQERNLEAFDAVFNTDVPVREQLERADAPLLLVEHPDCAMWTREGYEDVTAAFPDARTRSVAVKPSASPEFVELLREFCIELAASRAA